MTSQPDLTIDDFAPRLGRAFPVETSSGLLELMLAKVQPLPPSGRSGGSFRLEFHGPPQPVLLQASYTFHIGRARCTIFIVPVGPEGANMRYEAIFF